MILNICYPLVPTPTILAEFGEGQGLIFLDNIHCVGNETSLQSCVHGGVGDHDCDPSEDSGVICTPGNCLIIGKIIF